MHAGHNSHGQKQIELWAQVRYRKQPTSDQLVFQFLPHGSKTWTNVTAGLPLSTGGFVDVIVPEGAYGKGGAFRAAWTGPVSPSLFVSRDVSFP